VTNRKETQVAPCSAQRRRKPPGGAWRHEGTKIRQLLSSVPGSAGVSSPVSGGVFAGGGLAGGVVVGSAHPFTSTKLNRPMTTAEHIFIVQTPAKDGEMLLIPIWGNTPEQTYKLDGGSSRTTEVNYANSEPGRPLRANARSNVFLNVLVCRVPAASRKPLPDR
jgi:hypothetical protein